MTVTSQQAERECVTIFKMMADAAWASMEQRYDGNGSNNTKCSAVGGVAGKMSNGGNTSSTNATATTTAWGQTKYKAGNVGAAAGTSGAGASGGSGAAGPNDPSKIILAVLDIIWQVAGYAIGSAMGNPVLGQAIGTLGSVATHGIASAAKKGSSSGASLTTKAHDGAWIGAPKYHDGGWAFDEMPAVLKMGERVLSENEVSRMGGPQSVDAAARGSSAAMPPMQVNVQAIDSRNATESFVRDLGLALKRARRAGLGSLAIP